MEKVFYLMGILLLILSCENHPSKLEQRKAEIRLNDSLELVQARADLASADSVITFTTLELSDLKKQFVFEKQEKYQTVGYYVLPSYAGSKVHFSFFPEVEENGKLLWVTIDKARKYSFTEIPLDGHSHETLLPSDLSSTMQRDIAQCLSLARAMQTLQAAHQSQEKLRLKVRFYEKKLSSEP